MSQPPQPTQCGTSFLAAFNCGSGTALSNQSISAKAFLAAVAGSLAWGGVQVGIFLLLRLRLSRIYQPKSYLVPQRERVPPPPQGVIRWLEPLFTTPNLSIIQKCGLDAYFFLRYLRLLLKFFIPVGVVVLPILLPINRYGGGNNSGLDVLAISNVSPRNVGTRLWAHLILALLVIVWFCYIVYKEMRGFIRIRQAFLTSPQHRIRASATTVLVTGIPRKWLTLEALSGLYDVFPGGIKNIWINRNFDELSEKVQLRDKYAKQLETAETNLIKLCRKKHEKAEKEAAKKSGAKKASKQEREQKRADEDAAAEKMAQGQGVSAGDQHTTPHGLQDILHDEAEHERHDEEKRRKVAAPLGFMSQGLDKVGLGAVNQGLDVVGQGLGVLTKGVGLLGQRVVGDVDGGLHKAGSDFNRITTVANNGNGFVDDDDLYRQPDLSQQDVSAALNISKDGDAKLQSDKGSNRNPASAAVDYGIDASVRSATKAPQTNSSSHGAAAPTDKSHPLAAPAPMPGDFEQPSPASETTVGAPNMQVTRPSVESKPRSIMQIEEPPPPLPPRHMTWKIWKNNDKSIAIPSPQPHTADEDEFPLHANSVRRPTNAESNNAKHDPGMSGSKGVEMLSFGKKREDDAVPEYPSAIDENYDEDQDENARWRRFIEPKQRETMRLPLFSWFISLPLIGKKVDKIYWLRRELARLNLEIEADQNDVERFPFMNSAFVQFNHQVAAHMCCQSVSHHIPQNMAPRIVEISPDDIIWDNLSIKWWEHYLRTLIVLLICIGMVILYAVPVSFTSALSKLSVLGNNISWLSWVNRLPTVVTSIIQGLLPPILLNVILMLVPILFRILVKQQGVPTGNEAELGVQTWYFTFLFIQVFFIATLATGLSSFFTTLASQPGKVVQSLAESLPKAADYFYSYLLVNALSNSASTLSQLFTLLTWFLLAPILDNTPRSKWKRQTQLNTVQWGSYFPVFTNFAVIGIIYSVIAPFIIVFMVIIFGTFWIVQRYNVLYVTQFRNDTGGMLFPTAVNQLFVGIYFLEICLCGYFFISTNAANKAACIPQGAIMIAAIVLTAMYQMALHSAFSPLLRYLPITLEDEAVIRDEEFARAQASKFAPLRQSEADADDDRDIQDVLEARERAEDAANEAQEERDRQRVAEHRRSSHMSIPKLQEKAPQPTEAKNPQTNAEKPTWKTDRWRLAAPEAAARLRHLASGRREQKPTATDVDPQAPDKQKDVEAQRTVGDVLYSGFADELEDLTPDERDLLVRYAFQHSALRAKRPVVWIPRDRLGVSDDEIERAKRMSTVMVPESLDERTREEVGMVEKTNIWMSNDGTALDGKGRVVFRKSPPDFSNVDLISL